MEEFFHPVGKVTLSTDWLYVGRTEVGLHEEVYRLELISGNVDVTGWEAKVVALEKLFTDEGCEILSDFPVSGVAEEREHAVWNVTLLYTGTFGVCVKPLGATWSMAYPFNGGQGLVVTTRLLERTPFPRNTFEMHEQTSQAATVVGKHLHPSYYSIVAVEAPVPWSPVATAADVCRTVGEPLESPARALRTSPEAAEFHLPGDFAPGLGSYDVCWCD